MAQRGRPRKYPLPSVGAETAEPTPASSVTVQMTDDPDELDALLAAATAPRRPIHEDPNIDPDPNAPSHRQPESPDLPDPADPYAPARHAPDNQPDEEADDWEDRPADPPAAGANTDLSAAHGDAAAGTLDRPDAAVPDAGERPRPTEGSRASRLIEGEIIPKQKRYVSRITIVDAWQYPGTLSSAPDWIDRNWAAYADNYDPVRLLDPGPALRVPTHGDGLPTTLCRVGDFVARQEVKLLADAPGEIKIEVWEKEQFQRLFIPAATGTAEVRVSSAA